MRTNGKLCHLEHPVLSKIRHASKQEGDNARKKSGTYLYSSCDHDEDRYCWCSTWSQRGQSVTLSLDTANSAILLRTLGWNPGCLLSRPSFPLFWKFCHLIQRIMGHLDDRLTSNLCPCLCFTAWDSIMQG